MIRRLELALVVAAMSISGMAANAHSQDNPTPEDISKAQERVAKYEQSRLANLKDALDSPDVEFKILQPKLVRVMILQYEQSIGASGFSRRQRGYVGPMALVLGPSNVQKARMDLQDSLDKPDVTTGEIVEKLRALRAAREAAKAELQAAQADLRDFVTLRQEAVLVGMGLLD